MNRSFLVVPLVFLFGAIAQKAEATFHLMQIEQVIGGVNGDPTAQAIQLRMRSVAQTQMQNGILIAHDATGSNPVTIATFPGPVAHGTVGSRVLIVSPNFHFYTNPSVVGDQTMTNIIPASYLAAGSLTFEDTLGTIYWRLSWGGAGYTGSTTGSITNDADGEFGPPISSGLPLSNLKALFFTGAANAPSTNNAANYSLTAGAATFTNNNPTAFTVQTPPCVTCSADSNGDGHVNGDDIQTYSACVNANTPGTVSCVCGDSDHNGTFDTADNQALIDKLLGITPPGGSCN